MKVGLRILVILLSFGILIWAFLPEGGPKTETAQPESENPASAEDVREPAEDEGGRVVRDLFGGAALDSGLKAKETISEVNKERTETFGELEAGD